jgi:hypothetical protein
MPPPATEPQFNVNVDRNIRIPMRDGVELAADFYYPDTPGRFPTLVERTPYHRAESVLLRTGTPQYLAGRGYLVVIEDVRGRYGSDGVWYPFVADGWGDLRDGYDTVEWLARHPLSNGRVGTLGGSFAGQTQMLLAPTRPPHLACSYVREAASDMAQQWVYRGGAFELGFNLEWNLRHGQRQLTKQIDVIRTALEHKSDLYVADPLLAHPSISEPFKWLRDCLSHPDKDGFYEPFDIETQFGQIDTPMVHMGGWFDIFLGGTLANFAGVHRHGRSARARRSQFLLLGPWTHGPSVHDPAFARRVGDLDFGPDAVLDFNAEMLRWFDYWLRGDQKRPIDLPRVRYFLMAANRWCSAESWPPPESQPQRLYFARGRGRTPQSLNNGRLTPQKPTAARAADSFVYDPADPTPSIGGNTLHSLPTSGVAGNEQVPDFSATSGPRDQSPIEGHCLTYTTDPLPDDLAVVGPVRVILFISSSAPDTDFVAKLCDVFPDGRSIQVCDGILRARYRQSRRRPRPLEPRKTYKIEIDLWSTAWLFQGGHRLRVVVTSSCFPRFDRNPNTGRPISSSADLRRATNTVHCDAAHSSHVVLSVMDSSLVG